MKICKKKTTKDSCENNTDTFESKIEPLLIVLVFSKIDNDNSFYLSRDKKILVQYNWDNGDLSVSKKDMFCDNSYTMIIDRISYAFLKKALKKLM